MQAMRYGRTRDGRRGEIGERREAAVDKSQSREEWASEPKWKRAGGRWGGQKMAKVGKMGRSTRG
jgi:hypothetical protein